ncbi:hypothetical protein RN001_003398 [Aquatica leii]|uniref:HAT C-terminal dimerisation domain-containing protein n=1 Tax=Aquatica leii TaxID=1421715 RepID=A0AAN7PI98_9COLE|nr:hypothetical protein RN001_003398 [Aquatica leii]
MDDSATGNKGNFLALVHLLAKYDLVLCEHLTKVKLQKKVCVSYLSPEIQNEFINCLGNHVRKKILAEVKEAKYFTIVFDSTPDLSHKDQTMMESFSDFLETEGKKAEDISKMILDKIESNGLDMRRQAYDNAAVGNTFWCTNPYQGNPNAQYVACSNHNINLVGVHAASVAVNSVTFFSTMDRVFNYFLSSTHRSKVLTDITGQGVKRLIETRWSARYEAIAIMKSHYTEIIEVLESLLQNIKENAVTRSDAGLLLPALQSLPFLAFLGLWNRVLCEINDTQLYLQTKGLNMHHCAMKINALQLFLVDNRDVMVNDALSYTKTTCEDLDIDIAPRRIKKTKKMTGEEAANAGLGYDIKLRQEMYESVDRITQEIKTRFHQLHELDVKYSFLTPTNLLNPEYKCEFKEEPKRLRNLIAVADTKDKYKIMKGSFELLEFIQQCSYGISVPIIVIMVRIFLTIATSIAASERSFSKLKLIKNYLRSTMGSTRLSNLAIFSIEQSITDEINFDDVINNFAAIKAIKVKL